MTWPCYTALSVARNPRWGHRLNMFTILRGSAVVAAVATMLILPFGRASAQKPPPLGAPDVGAPAPPRATGGKPPPLGGTDESRQAPDTPRRAPDDDEHSAASGTGFIVAPGRLLTNNHVVDGCARMTARNALNQRVPARVDAIDQHRDLAVLTVPTDFGPPLVFRADPPVRRGESIVTYGFPLSGLLSSGPSLTTGDISALSGLRDNPGNFAITAPVQPGNSGGPLLDSQALVIGVVVAKLNAARVAEMTGGDIPQNVNFAVKGTEALAFLQEKGVTVRTASSTGPDKRAFEVGEIANPSTVYLQCFH